MNTNCLDGWKCPQCAHEGPSRVSVSSWRLLHDDGVEQDGDTDYSGDSACECPECGKSGRVKDFNEGSSS